MSYCDYQVNIHEPEDQSVEFFASMELLNQLIFMLRAFAIDSNIVVLHELTKAHHVELFTFRSPSIELKI